MYTLKSASLFNVGDVDDDGELRTLQIDVSERKIWTEKNIYSHKFT